MYKEPLGGMDEYSTDIIKHSWMVSCRKEDSLLPSWLLLKQKACEIYEPFFRMHDVINRKQSVGNLIITGITPVEVTGFKFRFSPIQFFVWVSLFVCMVFCFFFMQLVTLKKETKYHLGVWPRDEHAAKCICIVSQTRIRVLHRLLL